jgi:hypothetical protein
MHEITIIQNNSFSIPILNFAGTATDIDFRKGFKNWHLARHLLLYSSQRARNWDNWVRINKIKLPIDAFKGVSAGFR